MPIIKTQKELEEHKAAQEELKGILTKEGFKTLLKEPFDTLETIIDGMVCCPRAELDMIGYLHHKAARMRSVQSTRIMIFVGLIPDDDDDGERAEVVDIHDGQKLDA